MKIYFSVSYSNLNDDIRKSCESIIKHLEDLGHRVINEKLFSKEAKPYIDQNEQESVSAQRNLTKLKKSADVIIFEISKPSVAIGQELSIALSLNKPVIALYNNNLPPHILRDEGGDLLILSQYSDENLYEVLERSVEFAAENQEVRFNFFISPSIGFYLDWISKVKKIPRSVYLRALIEREMRENKEYKDE
jgi:hypothetical protein